MDSKKSKKLNIGKNNKQKKAELKHEIVFTLRLLVIKVTNAKITSKFIYISYLGRDYFSVKCKAAISRR